MIQILGDFRSMNLCGRTSVTKRRHRVVLLYSFNIILLYYVILVVAFVAYNTLLSVIRMQYGTDTIIRSHIILLYYIATHRWRMALERQCTTNTTTSWSSVRRGERSSSSSSSDGHREISKNNNHAFKILISGKRVRTLAANDRLL